MPETMPNNEVPLGEGAPGVDLLDLDFATPQITPREVVQVEEDKAAIAEALASVQNSYAWDDADAPRRGFN